MAVEEEDHMNKCNQGYHGEYGDGALAGGKSKTKLTTGGGEELFISRKRALVRYGTNRVKAKTTFFL